MRGDDQQTGHLFSYLSPEQRPPSLSPSFLSSPPSLTCTAKALLVQVDGERMYAYFAQGGLFAYGLDGKAAWSVKLPFSETRNGSGTSPVVAGDRLLLNRDTVTDPFIMAVDKRSGAVLWRVAHEVWSRDELRLRDACGPGRPGDHASAREGRVVRHRHGCASLVSERER